MKAEFKRGDQDIQTESGRPNSEQALGFAAQPCSSMPLSSQRTGAGSPSSPMTLPSALRSRMPRNRNSWTCRIIFPDYLGAASAPSRNRSLASFQGTRQELPAVILKRGESPESRAFCAAIAAWSLSYSVRAILAALAPPRKSARLATRCRHRDIGM